MTGSPAPLPPRPPAPPQRAAAGRLRPGQAALGGLLWAAWIGWLVALLVLTLNPAVARSPLDHLLVVGWLVPLYALGGFVPLAVVLLVPRSGRGRRVIVALAVVAVALVYLDNIHHYRHALPSAAVVAGWAGFIGLMLGASVQLAGRGPVVLAVAGLWAWACSLVASPGPGRTPPTSAVPQVLRPASRVLFIGLDAADPDVLFPLAEKGELPNIGRLMDGGAYARVRSMTPCESQSLWTTIATGRLPRDHGITGFLAFRLPGMRREIKQFPRRLMLGRLENLGLLQIRTQGGHERRAAALWDILSQAGWDVGVLNWWASYPAPRVQGFLVSNFHFYRQRGGSSSGGEVYPKELYQELEAFVKFGADVPDSAVETLLGCPSREADKYFPLDLLKDRCLASDLTYFPMARHLYPRTNTTLFALYLNGLDPIEHYFWRHRNAVDGEPETRCFRGVVDNYYRYYDRLVGEMVASAGDSTTVVLLSDHGMSRVSSAKRLYESVVMRNPLITGMHEDAPDGIIVLAGRGIRAAGELPRPTLLDVAPTLLALLGMPIANDMPGEPLLGAMDKAFLVKYPISHIDSYGGAPPLEAPGQTGSLDQLRALGYLP
jgi:predicted AlkP superfamily phosphohydrolase/phosphomutase